MLATSIFSFSHNVFKRSLSQGRKNPELRGKELKNHIGLHKLVKVIVSLYMKVIYLSVPCQ